MYKKEVIPGWARDATTYKKEANTGWVGDATMYKKQSLVRLEMLQCKRNQSLVGW